MPSCMSYINVISSEFCISSSIIFLYLPSRDNRIAVLSDLMNSEREQWLCVGNELYEKSHLVRIVFSKLISFSRR